MKRFLSFALTFALLSTFCVSAMAGGIDKVVTAENGIVTPDNNNATEYTITPASGDELTGDLTVRSGSSGASGTITVNIESPYNDPQGVPDFSGTNEKRVEVNAEGSMKCWDVYLYKADAVIDGDVVGGYSGIFGDDFTVEVNGNLSAAGYKALFQWGDVGYSAEIAGDVSGQQGIDMMGNCSVVIGGDISSADGNSVCISGDKNTAVVEGVLNGTISGTVTDSNQIAAGEITQDTLTSGTDVLSVLRFLIGTDDSSEATMNDITLSGSGASKETLTGIDDKLFGTTKTVNELANAGDVEVTLAGRGRKIDSVSGMGSGVTPTYNGDGTATLKFNGDGFLGGLNKLIIKLGDLLKPASAKKVCPTVKAEIVGVEGEGAETFNAEQRAGFKVSAEFIERNGSDAQILLGDEEIPSGCFAVITLPDGRDGVLFSNSFMATLGAGEHVFRVVVGEAEFTVTVHVEVL